jgi:hypothetical protein
VEDAGVQAEEDGLKLFVGEFLEGWGRREGVAVQELFVRLDEEGQSGEQGVFSDGSLLVEGFLCWGVEVGEAEVGGSDPD